MLKSPWIVLLFVLLCTGCHNGALQEQKPVVVAYLPDYRLANLDIDELWLGPVTDLIYFSLVIPEDGVFDADAVNAKHLEVLKSLQRRSGARLLLCIGGWDRSDRFAEVSSDDLRRQAMIDSLLAVCLAHSFDGIDYDWEHPANEQAYKDYALLIEESASRFSEHGLIVTAAQAGWQDFGPKAYNALHRVHLMSYAHPYPQATMQLARQEVEQLIAWGCPKEKIALGIPFYGRDHARATRPYHDLTVGTAVDPGLDVLQDYAFNGPTTVGLKTQYALTEGLAGVMIWEITQDDQREQTLLRAIAEGLDSAEK